MLQREGDASPLRYDITTGFRKVETRANEVFGTNHAGRRLNLNRRREKIV
jgi:hypothetical protein